MSEKLQLAAVPALLLTVDGEPFRIEFPLRAVAVLEEELGRPLRTPQAWLGLPAKDIPAVLAAGLTKHHADVAEKLTDTICENLNPEGLDEVLYALCRLAFPRYIARFEEHQAKRKGNALPNEQSGDAR